MFERNNYNPSDGLIRFLAQFYNLVISFSNTNIDFRIKKILSDYPSKYYSEQFSKITNIDNPTPFAEISDGHMVLIATHDNHIFGVFDDYVIDFGNDYFGMLKRLADM